MENDALVDAVGNAQGHARIEARVDGVIVPPKPCGTVQMYWPDASESEHGMPPLPVKVTPLSPDPFSVTVPVNGKFTSETLPA